jgi:hypothetical protein
VVEVEWKPAIAFAFLASMMDFWNLVGKPISFLVVSAEKSTTV